MSQRGTGFKGLAGMFGRAVLRRSAALFRRREIMVRSGGRVRYLALPGAVQMFLLAGVVGVGGWLAYTTHIWLDFATIVDDRDREIARAWGENRVLLGTIARMKSEFSDVAGTLERNHRELGKLLAQNGGLRDELARLRTSLSAAEKDRSAGEKRTIALRSQLDSLEKRLAGAEKRSKSLAAALESTRLALADSKRDNTRIATARDTLKTRIAGLEKRLLALRDSQKTLVGRVSERTQQDIQRAERIILSTGLNPGEMLAQADTTDDDKDDGPEAAEDGTGQGGPFIPAGDAASSAASGHGSERFVVALRSYDRSLARWEELQKLLRSLPLVAPLDHYRLSSGHGKRRDPINGKLAIHEGVDLAVQRGTTVHATAPGKVVFAGRHGRYGRMVEIDHGYGVHTRYAHLRRVLVRRGAEVKFGQKIGQVGNSGRSTGPHLHYEVLVDGKSVDPERFMRAGKNVFKG